MNKIPGSGALSGKILLIRIIEIIKMMLIFGKVRFSRFVPQSVVAVAANKPAAACFPRAA